MKAPIDGFWAKLTRNDKRDVETWHPLVSHCADVAASLHVLLEETALGERLARSADLPNLHPHLIQRLCFLAALHDAGKANHGFQRRAYSTRQEPGARAGHLSVVIDLISDKTQTKNDLIDALGLRDIAGWFDAEEGLIQMLLATWGHHGAPIAPNASGLDSTLWRANSTRAPLDGVRELIDAARGWFPDAFSERAPLVPTNPEFQHMFNGALTIADWLGSDSHFFTFDDGDPTARFDWALDTARTLTRRAGIAPALIRASLGPQTPTLSTFSSYSPRPLQAEIASLPMREAGGVVVLESDTGSGKTEAALVHFLQLYHAGLVDSLYFALPTRTAATQIYERLVAAIAAAFPSDATRPPVTLAVPGYLRVDDVVGQQLAHFEVLWDDDDAQRWRYRGWASESPKRYLMGAIVVGTIDQVLLSTLQVKHAQMRASALSRALLVVDEVHASDTYMTRLLDEVLEHHLRVGSHALLMSATLGSCALARYASPSDTAPGRPDLDDATQTHYPLISLIEGKRDGIAAVIEVEPTDYTKRVEVELSPNMSDADAVAAEALRHARQGARVLIIKNTVKGCLEVQAAVEELAAGADLLLLCGDVPVPHHSRYAGADRRKLDEVIERDFGKRSDRDGVIAVATQTVQQSLDLDADIMFTDICPMDVLLQRIGRLHRHSDRERPHADYVAPRCVVLVPDDRDMTSLIQSGRDYKAIGQHGVGTVYQDLRIIEATWRQLEEHDVLEIPAMNRELVERSTHDDLLEAIASALGDEWTAHERWLEGTSLADSTQAKHVLLRREEQFEKSCYSTQLDVRAQTRLGAQDRIVEFDAPWTSPLGSTVSTLQIPWHMCPRDCPDELAATDFSTTSSRTEFTIGDRSYTYTRHGLEVQP